MKIDAHSIAILATALTATMQVQLHADTMTKADNADNLNLGSSWVGAVVPSTNDVAAFDATITAKRTVLLGEDLTWEGIAFLDGVAGTVTINAGNTLTLGAGGIANTDDSTLEIKCAIVLGADQTWSNTGGFFELGTSTLSIDTAGHQLTLAGAGSKTFNAPITGGGDVIIEAGTGQFRRDLAESDLFIRSGATGYFDVWRGTHVRAANVQIDSSLLRTVGDSTSGGVGQVDQISGTLTAINDVTIQIQPSTSGYEQFFASNFVRTARATTLFRGTNLGVYSFDTMTNNSANIGFTVAPEMTGGGGAPGSSTLDILPGAFGDTATTGNGLGLVTYDATHGIRLLDTSTEYTSSITDGQSQLDNVRLVNVSGIPLTNVIDSATTINALVFDVSSTNGSGILITGSGSLTPASGIIFGRQTISTSTSADAMTIAVPTLDLGGNEGVFLFQTYNAQSYGIYGGQLTINSRITNDGGKGIVFRGYGVAQLRGTEINDYTGDTVLQSGNLYINKSVDNASIPGNLIIDGGNLINPGNEINDNADIFVNSGGYHQRPSLNTGSGASETFRDLYMTGGTFNTSSGGTGQGSTTARNAVLSGGTWNVNYGHKVSLSGTLTMNGGNLLVKRNTNNGQDTTRFTATGGLVITNTATGPYTPITIYGGYSSTAYGGTLILGDSLTFVGNDANAETTVIETSTPGTDSTWGAIALDGAKTFDIGDGPAATDLALQAILTDWNATTGSVVKAGLGTLALNGTNTFTGGMTVSAGTLAGTGVLASDLSVESGTTLAPGSVGTIGTFSVNADASFAEGSTLAIDISGSEADLVQVSGTVSGSLTVPVAQDQTDGEWLIMTASSFSADFSTTNPRWSLYARNNGTELWLTRTPGTMIIIR